MKDKKLKFFGARLMKTGIAVFITATICYYFDLPVVFAVIIAIATIEPTASDSIKKGMIRFPAALIGAGLAMTFTYWFGHSPITYTLAAVFTIYLCMGLKLEAGALIATITAVAMIPVTQDHYFLTFIERSGTTTIGLVVSTFVNFFIFPPRFSEEIKNRNDQLFTETATLLKKRADELILHKKAISKECQKEYKRITSELAKSFQLAHYQREEWKYHRHSISELRAFVYETKKLEQLQQIHYHLGHLITVHINDKEFIHSNQELLKQTVDSTVALMKTAGRQPTNDAHVANIKELDELFWHTNDGSHPSVKKYHHHFTTETIVLFVILSIHDVLEELEIVSKRIVEEKPRVYES
ncbi:FUSC family protein [Halalkalibacter alkalisediminis]|uniref:Aromatic acid exporter family protein n=1 Tax=Halalkalibacter alkalisediminis TaxID=935616 RepID=A0ABV6NG70_9BACI|nr:aromatic acid exporter family protein [Halalkalibacter alkalisediminis]